MNRPDQIPDNPERDPVWALLERSPAPRASGRFADDVLRAVRLAEETPEPWWKRVASPWAWGSLSAAAAGVALALLVWGPVGPLPDVPASFATVESLSDLQDIAEEEMLVAAADHLSEFSDAELVVLLGF